ncbi:MAG: hypothetical protein P9L96_01380 [Candidatus Gygaella obscura]|nr:hypothetical protein [Candidatus Gygaella obscura]
MKATLILGLVLIMFVSFISIAKADVYVRGYHRNNGTYVAPHYRSNPDGVRSNNWGCCGNVNPYNGKVGTGW